MSGRGRVLVLAAASAAAFLIWLVFVGAPSDLAPRSNTPGLVDNSDAVIQGVQMERLEATSIPADFLWGAGKFAAFSVTAPSNSALRIERIAAHRVGGSDEIMPSVWLRLNRQRIYADIPIKNGAIGASLFPPPVVENGYIIEDTVIDEVAHRLVKNPPNMYEIAAGESVVVELFGNIEAAAVVRPTAVHFCLDAISGTLIATGEQAQSRLNETCWSDTTILPLKSQI